ncbi:DUF2752 domain-containing protein [Pedobacter sp. LMG 31464]|uniref:DUF2752 domain-containing protein n=1 Tax=Pedobacter planticolens TaxID=2679964 RepID=A0A923DZB9_9SPHI|nr:DUF2752 domain-containing protein [Pedobacter planticolens]MBB2146869.1 DUF2752 domain-containing protein [Pedobacter planticolens]
MKGTIILIIVFFLSESKGVINWLQSHLLSCPFKQTLGIDCPGCGMQRSVLELMQGNFISSFKLYPATLPIIILFIFTGFHLKFDFKSGAFFIKMLYIGITLIIVINYIYKIFTHQLI